MPSHPSHFTTEEPNPELLFVQHTLNVLGNPPNLRPELAPGGEWRHGKLTLTWGVRTITEPPTLHHPALKVPYLPRDITERLAIWHHHLKHPSVPLDFRDLTILTAIVAGASAS